jgi:hypothetical protein
MERTGNDTELRARGGAGLFWLGGGYVVAICLGPLAWIVLWIMAFGLWGPAEPASAAAIPGWLALALPPVIGIVLGWKARATSGWPRWVPLVAPAIPVAIAVAAYVVRDWAVRMGDSVLPWFGLVALYAYGPVVLGLLLRVAMDHRRRRSA